MTRLLTLAELLTASGGKLAGNGSNLDLVFSDIVYDSREVQPGYLFVALQGETSDGHNYLRSAIERGATAVILRQDWLEQNPESLPVPAVVVPDTLAAFQKVAGWWRSQYPDLEVIGITGSVGKTSTKELVAAVLSQHYKTFKSPKSYNNEFSLMPVMFDIQPEHELAVIEMGCGWGFGELRRVCTVARPRIGVILNISQSHLGRMGTIENIAKAKSEILEDLPADGWAILNGDDFRVRELANLTKAKPFFFGSDAGFDLWADEVQSLGLEGISFTAHYQGEARFLRLPLIGRHNVQTALVAIAVGLLNKLDWQEIEAGLNDPAARVRLLLKPGLNDSIILDDCYNASAVSMLAALDLVADTPVKSRKLALLGDMLELGDFTEEAHRLIGRRAAQVVSHLIVVGELAQIIGQEALRSGLAENQVTFAESKAAAAEILQKTLAPGDLLLVKASRGIALEHVVAKLTITE